MNANDIENMLKDLQWVVDTLGSINAAMEAEVRRDNPQYAFLAGMVHCDLSGAIDLIREKIDHYRELQQKAGEIPF